MGQQDVQEEVWFDVDLGRNGGRFAPRSEADVDDWLTKETEFWAWLQNPDTNRQINGIGNLHHYAREIHQTFNEIRQYLKSVPKNVPSSDPGFRANVDALRNFILERYRLSRSEPLGAVHSSNPDAAFVLAIKDKLGVVEAVAALTAVCSESTGDLSNALGQNSLKPQSGLYALCMMRAGIAPETPQAVRKTLEQLHGEFTKRHQDNVNDLEVLLGRTGELLKRQEKVVRVGRKLIGRETTRVRREMQLLRDEVTKDLEEYKKFLKDGLALQHPVDYWTEVANEHRDRSLGLMIVFVLSLLAVGVAAWQVLELTPLGEASFLKENPLPAIGYGVAFVGFAVWVPRLLLRSLFSNLHLKNDAWHRRTMALTYLALREGGHAEKDQMDLVLTQLFAPTKDGLVRDEPGPIAALETLKAMKPDRP